MNAVSRAGADLMLLLIRGNIPSGEMLAAKTDRDMALLAVKYNIALPLHLQHFPTLPPPKSSEEKERDARLAAATAAAEDARAADEKVKERPPRRTRMRLGHANEVLESPPRSPSSDSPGPSTSSPLGTPREPGAVPYQHPRRGTKADDVVAEQDLLGSGAATKERAPTNRKKKGKVKKESLSSGGEEPDTEQELLGVGNATKERAPTMRKKRESNPVGHSVASKVASGTLTSEPVRASADAQLSIK